MKPKPTCLRRLSLTLYILFCLTPALLAAPARKGLLNLRQPDGTLVQAYLTGDENGHLVLTPDGCSLRRTRRRPGHARRGHRRQPQHSLRPAPPPAGGPHPPVRPAPPAAAGPHPRRGERRRPPRAHHPGPVPGPRVHLLQDGLRETHQRRRPGHGPLLFQGPVEGRLHLPVRHHRPCHPPARIRLLRRQQRGRRG